MNKYISSLTIAIIFIIIVFQTTFSVDYKNENDILVSNNGSNFSFKYTGKFYGIDAQKKMSIEYNPIINKLIVTEDSNKNNRSISNSEKYNLVKIIRNENFFSYNQSDIFPSLFGLVLAHSFHNLTISLDNKTNSIHWIQNDWPLPLNDTRYFPTIIKYIKNISQSMLEINTSIDIYGNSNKINSLNNN